MAVDEFRYSFDGDWIASKVTNILGFDGEMEMVIAPADREQVVHEVELYHEGSGLIHQTPRLRVATVMGSRRDVGFSAADRSSEVLAMGLCVYTAEFASQVDRKRDCSYHIWTGGYGRDSGRLARCSRKDKSFASRDFEPVKFFQ